MGYTLFGIDNMITNIGNGISHVILPMPRKSQLVAINKRINPQRIASMGKYVVSLSDAFHTRKYTIYPVITTDDYGFGSIFSIIGAGINTIAKIGLAVGKTVYSGVKTGAVAVYKASTTVGKTVYSGAKKLFTTKGVDITGKVITTGVTAINLLKTPTAVSAGLVPEVSNTPYNEYSQVPSGTSGTTEKRGVMPLILAGGMALLMFV